MFASARRLIGRHRLAAIAGAGVAVAASSIAASRSSCLSITLDEAQAAALAKTISEHLASAETEVALGAVSTEAILAELRSRLATETVQKNTAYVFAKPHANTPAVLDVIKAKFAAKGITILQEGEVTGEQIDSKGYIDQHYYAIAEKSTLTSGKDLPVNADKFKGTFGEDWSTVVKEGRAFNALEFKKKFATFQGEGALDKVSK